MSKHKELENYKETYSQFLNLMIAYHNKHCWYVDKLTHSPSLELKHMLREMRKLSKDLTSGISASYKEAKTIQREDWEIKRKIKEEHKIKDRNDRYKK